MKRFGNIYEKICSIENLKLAFTKAKLGKYWYKEVKMVESDPDYYLNEIRNMLINKTYRVSNYTRSKINDKGKERELYKLPFYPDRIIQWAILLQTEEIFTKTFVPFTCSSLKDRGGIRASILVSKYLKNINIGAYCLKFDVKKFYPNIDHSVLKQLLRKKFKDKDLLWLFDLIIDSFPGETGIPIGSYSSQFFANFYLCYFDHWAKEEKRMKYYVRYMDDVVIIHESKELLHGLKDEVEEYLHNNLKLRLKENWQVFPVESRGIDFVGFRHFKRYKLLRKKIYKNYRSKMLRIKKMLDSGKEMDFHNWCSANSYVGWLKHCDGHRLKEKYYKLIQRELKIYYYKNIKKSKGRK